MRSLVALLLLIHASAGLEAQEAVGPALIPASLVSQNQIPVPVFMPSEVRPIAILRSATEGAADELEAMLAWNRAGNVPPRNGFVRPLPLGKRLNVSEFQTTSNRRGTSENKIVWAGRVEVAGAHRIRIHLEEVRLPVGSQLWVSGGSGETVGPFGLNLLGPGGELWTPSVSGPVATLIVQLPEKEQFTAHALFRVTQVAEIFALEDQNPALPLPSHVQSCLIDGRCITTATLDVIDFYRSAVAQLQYLKSGSSFVCTGALLNDTDDSGFIPYLLTANHCFSSQASASSLEAFWDYVTSTCGGPFPGLGSLPRSSGSTLLATSSQTDFTFVRLNSIPGARALLGWNANPSAVGQNTFLNRLSHPAPNSFPYSQGYSRTRATNTPAGTCGPDQDGRPLNDLTKFIYSAPDLGATFPGSSGAPVILAGGFVVGQLYGACALDPTEPCLFGAQDYTIDGRFSSTFPSIAQWLNPTTGNGPCVPGANTACLANSRFEVRVDWQTTATSGAAQVMAFGGQRAENNDSAFFWFFSATNFEMGLKILNACGINGRFWVFISGLTDQGWTVRIRDTQTGSIKTYNNPTGRLTPTTADTLAGLPCN